MALTVFQQKILKTLSNDISNQLSELFNLSFSLGVFPSILKSSKVIPVFKKESKLKWSIYRPISLNSNIDKILPVWISIIQITLNGKRIYSRDSVKYLGTIIDKNLTCRHQTNNVAAKLNKANAMLSEIRHIVNFNFLKSIYQAIFVSHLNYLLLVWAQNANSKKRPLVLLKKWLRIMHFLKRNAHTSNLFKNLNVLKLPDQGRIAKTPTIDLRPTNKFSTIDPLTIESYI